MRLRIFLELTIIFSRISVSATQQDRKLVFNENTEK